LSVNVFSNHLIDFLFWREEMAKGFQRIFEEREAIDRDIDGLEE
jgi:hypothetical protein